MLLEKRSKLSLLIISPLHCSLTQKWNSRRHAYLSSVLGFPSEQDAFRKGGLEQSHSGDEINSSSSIGLLVGHVYFNKAF